MIRNIGSRTGKVALLLMTFLSLTLVSMAPLLSGCKATLDSGGAYAPTNSVGQPSQAPDMAFYQVDATFNAAYALVDAAFTIEQNNRAFLWSISPQIKLTLDGIRPQAAQAVQAYAASRSAYLGQPTPAGLSALQNLIARMQAFGTAAQAAIASLPPGTIVPGSTNNVGK